MDKLKIGITQGDGSQESCKRLLEIFEDPAMAELCTPVMYGSPAQALACRKQYQLNTNFQNLKDAGEAKPERLNIVDCMTEGNKQQKQAEEASLNAAMHDLEEGKIDALVNICPDLPFPDINSTRCLFTNEDLHMAFCTNSTDPASLTQEQVQECIREMNMQLKRDFSFSRPRIAVLAMNETPSEQDETILKPAIQAANEERADAYGPFQWEEFFASGAYKSYDGLLGISHEQATRICSLIGITSLTQYDTDPERLVARPFLSDNLPNQCIYTLIDVNRHRIEYKQAHENPLPKLFHDKREDNRHNNNIE